MVLTQALLRWRRADSNRRPPACKSTTGNLTTSVDARMPWSGYSQESHGCHVATGHAGSRTASVLPRHRQPNRAEQKNAPSSDSLSFAPPMRDVFLVGAGFSKAISPVMPTLQELGEAVNLPRAEGSAPSEAQETDFESALTLLAQDQPWLPAGDNLKNRASFLEASKQIAGHLSEMQKRVLSESPPSWLLKLVQWWMDTRCTVITTNYDVLIERAFKELRNTGNHKGLYSVPIVHALSREGAILGGGVIGPFELLKLHGSLNWYYSGRESYFGETIFDAEVPTGWSTSSQDLMEEVRWAISDKTPLVIPPTFGKSSFFQHETILTIWQKAWRAVTNADRLTCVGYSLPPSDLNMVHLLRGVSFSSGQVVVVNRNPDALDHYRRLLPGIEVHNPGKGSWEIADFVNNFLAEGGTVRDSD